MSDRVSPRVSNLPVQRHVNATRRAKAAKSNALLSLPSVCDSSSTVSPPFIEDKLELPQKPAPRMSFKSKFIEKALKVADFHREFVSLGDEEEVKESSDCGKRAELFSQLRKEAKKVPEGTETESKSELIGNPEEARLDPTSTVACSALQSSLSSTSLSSRPKLSLPSYKKRPKSSHLSKFLDISAAEGDSQDDNFSFHPSDSDSLDSQQSDISDLVDDSEIEQNAEAVVQKHLELQLTREIGQKCPQFDRILVDDRATLKRLKQKCVHSRLMLSPEVKEKIACGRKLNAEDSPEEEAAKARFYTEKELWKLKAAGNCSELIDGEVRDVLGRISAPKNCTVVRSLLQTVSPSHKPAMPQSIGLDSFLRR